jgi:hypothetical protein
MAKIKAYTVLRAFPARHKDNADEEVWVTRENEHLIPEMLSTARIKDGIDSGALQEYETDGETPLGAASEPAKPPAKATRRAKE